MKIECSSTLEAIAPSASIRVAERVRQMKARGEPVLSLTIGEPDIPVRAEILAAAEKAMRDGQTGYTSSRGIAPLREAIASLLRAKHGLTYQPDEILVTPGAKQAIVYAMMALLNEGDEALIPEPSWVSYCDIVRLAHGTPVPVPSQREGGFLPSIEELEARCTARTKVLILNNPVNPTGAIWPERTLEAMAQFCQARNIVVLSDEIYEDIVFDGRSIRAMASIEGMAAQTITISGFSKTFSMTGFRVGYAAAPLAITDYLLKAQEQVATCASSVSQAAALAAVPLAAEQARHIRQVYETRRNAVLALARRLGLTIFEPQGTFYCFVDVRGIAEDSVAASERILLEQGVATVPGAAYGRSGEGYVRISLVHDIPILEEALRRLERLAHSG